MAGKPKLYYFDGRGKMESICWLLAAAGVEFEEEFLETREQYEKLLRGGSLLFQHIPMAEIDGMKMVQTRAILSYIAAEYNLYGKDLKERALIDMYVGGTDDFLGFILMFAFSAEDKEKQCAVTVQKATSRYFPAYEKVLKDHGQDFLVGNNFSWADVHLLEAILMVEEEKSDVLSGFPQLQAFKARISSIPTIKKFLEPGRQRKPVPDDKHVETVRRVLRVYHDIRANGALLFQQVPMVQMGGMKMAQPRAILNHTARKAQPLWDGLEGQSLLQSFMFVKLLCSEVQQLIEAILMVEDKVLSILSEFPFLQAFKARVSNMLPQLSCSSSLAASESHHQMKKL
ncbi:LOW QUALITY PROTEIN: glutathione S-transferase 3-like [Phoenicopterus ruber ruber]